jgi:pyruvate formate lyase activating enzyme
VLDTLKYVRHETDTWLEITTLLIPDKNDSDAELQAMCRWIASELGSDVPLHFSAFHPDYKMQDIPATPMSSLTRAREIAINAGLEYVYTGNVHDRTGGTTWCPQCARALIVRDWYRIEKYELDRTGHCPQCGAAIAGRFTEFTGQFGNRRMPVTIRHDRQRTPGVT